MALLQLDQQIHKIDNKGKELKKDVKLKRDAYYRDKKNDDKYRGSISKVDRSLYSQIEDIFSKYSVDPAAYHGGKLNGVACQKLSDNAHDIFQEVRLCCLTYIGRVDDSGVAMNTADEGEVNNVLYLYTLILSLLDKAFSILQTGWGVATDASIDDLDEVLQEICKMWRKLGLSWIPKFHCFVDHSLDQYKSTRGYKELHEDFVK